MTDLTDWGNFYLIIGAAAGALIGLQFVALTLIAQQRRRSGPEAGAAFATPNIVHFCSTLFLSGLITAPWHSMTKPAALWGAFGLGGLIYTVLVARRMRKQDVYEPVLEDWLFHCFLPLAAYGLLFLSSILELWWAREPLFAIALAVLVLLLVGIHNSWDAVTWHVFAHSTSTSETEDEDSDQ